MKTDLAGSRPQNLKTGASPQSAVRTMSAKIKALDWEEIIADLDLNGNAQIKNLVPPEECDILAALYSRDELFRSRVVMARHGFGMGEYKYFGYPLPDTINDLRSAIYPYLVPVANRWNELLKNPVRFPNEHLQFINRCHNAGQIRPTPLLLQYGPGDYNCLHQDLYGQHVFPIQVAILLSDPESDFAGGEFVMTEQSPSTSPKATVVPLKKGDAVVFTVANRPVPGKRGYGKGNLRHGGSRIHGGHRHTIGIIFHDAT